MPWIKGVERKLLHREDIRNQPFGWSLDPEKLNKLGWREAHLDRKLERTLSMLMKLKELRVNVWPPKFSADDMDNIINFQNSGHQLQL